MLPSAAVLAAVVVSTSLAGVDAQEHEQCDLATLFAHLSDIQAGCCINGNLCSSSYPGEGDECSTECGEMFEPFWDSCGSMLTLMGVGGTEGMITFYDSCLETLYPPGSCADVCTPSMMHCRLMEVQAACCGDPTNCPQGDPVPHSCPVECALVFPFFLESCHDALQAQGSDVAVYERFSQACVRQDTTALVEYAIDLLGQGCSVELDGLRRLAEPEDLEEHVAQSLVVDDSRRLQAVGTGACEGFVDDPNGDLTAHGVSCEQVLALGCDADLSRMQPTMARGSLVKFACPVSCGECHRKGLSRWIETPVDCPWDEIDERLIVVNEACCAVDGANPDVACPDGRPPRACSALCAVEFHSLSMDCGEKLLMVAGEVNAAGFTAFDQLCTSEQSVDPMVFLDAIATATCCSSDNCGGCLDGTACTPVDGCVWYADQACLATSEISETTETYSVNGRSDGAYELLSNGHMYIDTSDYELIHSGSQSEKITGIIFPSVGVPAGVSVGSAFVTFDVDEVHAGQSDQPVTISIYGQVGAAAPPSTSGFDISSRPTTASSVIWEPEPAANVHDDMLTPDIHSIVHEIVNGDGWHAGANMGILFAHISGSGNRWVESSRDNHGIRTPAITISYMQM